MLCYGTEADSTRSSTEAVGTLRLNFGKSREIMKKGL